MQRVVAAALCVVLAVAAATGVSASEGSSEGGVDIELHTGVEVEVTTAADAPVMIPARTRAAAPVLTRAFTARGGRAAPLETTTLLIDGEAVVRLARVEGQLAGKNAELTMHLTSLPRKVRAWLRRFVSGKYKKHELAIVTKMPGSGTPSAPLAFSRFTYKGVLIRELSFPKLGAEGGVFKVRILYQNADEAKNVKPHPIANGVSTVRTQFFKLKLANTDPKKADKAGERMGKSVHTLNGFSITRSGGFGKQDATTLRVEFPTHSGPKAVANDWSNWLTRPSSIPKDKNLKERDGTLTLYHWSGASMDRAAGDDARGTLKPLLTLTLHDVTIDKLESGEGVATLKVDKIEMSQ